MAAHIAAGPHAGRKLARLQTLLGDTGAQEGEAGKVGGFLLHASEAAVANAPRVRVDQRDAAVEAKD